MGNYKIGLLIKTLKTRTEEGLISWNETEKDGVYQVAFPNYTIRVSIRMSEQLSYDYMVSIYNLDGKLIEEVSDPDLSSYLGGDDNSYNFMRDLYDNARRNAMGVDKALDEILSKLGPITEEIEEGNNEEDLPF
jgi:hypothetical protein